MIDRTRLLSDLQKLLRKLEADLLERSDSSDLPEVGQILQGEYQKVRKAERTAQSYEEWRSDYITQIAAAWVLSCVFARFLEDNRLVDPPKLAGPGEGLGRARDEHEIYFRAHPKETDREYLQRVFSDLARLPGAEEIFGKHNPIHEHPNRLSGDAAGELLKFFQRIDADTGALVHDFTDPNCDTRFLGDLYQDLSEAARKKYALLQTPEFVEEFILDRTLDPAIDEFGLEGFRMIDPACGSGHFLLGTFQRLLQQWLKKEPSTNVRVLVQRVLNSVHGVDVNPYAVAIARFRLFLVALRESDIHRLQDAPDFHFNLAAGDSLLHGVPGREQHVMHFHELAHNYKSEDLPALRRILQPGTYHVVVANPPYITPKDKALSKAYRERYSTCHRQYSLAVPFMQRIFSLVVSEGFIGQITSNSFMKREFGKKLVEEFLPSIDLMEIIDTSGAYIPGHGTPTVILFGRNRQPISKTVRTVMGKNAEPSTPLHPEHGKVWTSVVQAVHGEIIENQYVSRVDLPRRRLTSHPWTLTGGGAAELKEQLETYCSKRLYDFVESIGRTTAVGEDDVWIMSLNSIYRYNLRDFAMPFIIGEIVRDWTLHNPPSVIYPYDRKTRKPVDPQHMLVTRYLWRFRTVLKARTIFGRTITDSGKRWYEHLEHYQSKFGDSRGLGMANIASHNHFILDTSCSLFNCRFRVSSG